MRKNRSDTLKKKLVGLSVIIAIEIVLVGILWSKTTPSPNHGFIIKSGNSYVLLWRNQDNTFEGKKYGQLRDALSFAGQNLKLKAAHNPEFPGIIERVWEREDIGKHLVFWKTTELNILHRLTFQNISEARVFADAFKHGAYTTSPYGHAIFLAPIQ